MSDLPVISISIRNFQDNNSQNKEENLTNAAFDQATYHIRGEEVSIETPFLLTTNLESRSERAGDREILILFEISTATPEVLASAEKKVCKERSHKKIEK